MSSAYSRQCLLIALVCLAAAPAFGASADQCFSVLTGALRDKSPWVRVHAAEALVWLKRPEPALATFRPEAETSQPQYRIVVWRVLGAAEPEPAQRRRYIERIREALLDPQASDQTHAMEALAKLREPANTDAERRYVREVADAQGPASPFAVWRLAQDKHDGAPGRLLKLLRADDATIRARAAYVLGRLRPLPADADAALAAALGKEPPDSSARPMIRAAMGLEEVRKLATDSTAAPAGRYVAAMRLAELGSANDRALLEQLLNDADADVRVAAAYATLAIDTRSASPSPRTQPH